jgi:hypothetical protein
LAKVLSIDSAVLKRLRDPPVYGYIDFGVSREEKQVKTKRVLSTVVKDFIVIEGATHGITPCVRCEQTPGQYSNSVKNFLDYVAKWVNARF